MSKTVKLNSGYEIPVLGLGTWLHKYDFENQMGDAVVYAIKKGYRHIDCAYIYLNESEIGAALGKVIGSVVKREELFIVGKLWNHSHQPDQVEAACDQTMRELGVDYLDMYLMHFPTGFQKVAVGTPGMKDAGKHANYDVFSVPQNEETAEVLFDDVDYLATWKAMEELVKKGKVKSIGVSNFNHVQMERLINEGNIKPSVLQVERNPRFSQPKLSQWCKENDVLMIGYSPFGSPDLPWGRTDLPHILADPTLQEISKQVGKSTAQVVLRWNIQGGLGICGKSVFENELDSNLEIFDFELSDDQMKAIDGLNLNERKLVPIITLTDGTKAPRDGKHKYYPYHEEY